ncbi:MAG TPA: aminoacyl-tRNA hydrolase, partial [Burkholderiales bacterium]|nr:aminoacyl-tRNA hydrolase [Burkholderiales bacterium]
MKLIVGLGNPGRKYEATRHNAGFWWVDAVARAVGAFATFYRIAPEDILVAHDELDLPPGEVKLKFGGGLSGNGMKDVAAVLGTRDFWRLRLGIGHPRDLAASEQEVVDYVLHGPRADERKAIDEAIEKALESW